MELSPLPGIHDDILLSVFSFLPIPDLARCAAVCEQWHRIVKGFSHLWKGKRYVSDKSPRESDEARAVLSTLPPLQEVVVKQNVKFVVKIFYPRVVLLVTDISDLEIVQECQRLRCTYLSTELDIAECTLSSCSPIDLVGLGKLRIVGTVLVLESDTGAECAIGSALELCPNLKELSICVDSLSADYLDATEGIDRLRTLKIECPDMKDLSFLRHCTAALEVLEMKGCCNMPSAAYAGLRHLENLQRLRLHDCCVVGGDLEAAATGLRSLVMLQLVDCMFVSDLSFLHHYGQLRELQFESEGVSVTGLRHLPPGIRSLSLVGDAVTAADLSEALPFLPQLEELDLGCMMLDHLGFLCQCPQLRRLCLEFSMWCDESELSNLRHLVRLETLDLRGCRVAADVLCAALPSLSRLGTLSLAHAECVDHLRFLRHCPQLHTLSLFATYALEVDAYQELCHLSNLQQLYVSQLRYNYVCEVVRPRLPQVKICCSKQFK